MKNVIISMLFLSVVYLLVGCLDNQQNNSKHVVSDNYYQEVAQTGKTPSGVYYEILSYGTGEQPKPGQLVTVHYSGWLDQQGAKGPKFDSSIARGEPFTFSLGADQVIKGWDEGIKTMRVGETRRLFVPASLGYGQAGAGNIIPPDSDLIFDIELLAVK